MRPLNINEFAGISFASAANRRRVGSRLACFAHFLRDFEFDGQPVTIPARDIRRIVAATPRTRTLVTFRGNDVAGIVAASDAKLLQRLDAAGMLSELRESLQTMDCLSIPTTCGSVDPRLELEDRPFLAWPGNALPFIYRPGGRSHDVCTPTHRSTIPFVGPTSAYPGHYPGLWLLGPSSPRRHAGDPCSRYRPPERARRGFPRSDDPLLGVGGRDFPPGLAGVNTGP